MAKGERCRNEENSPDLNQITKDALDELFSKEQQTYEEFLQGFTFLKKDDVAGFKAHSSHFDSPNGATCTCQEKKTDEIKIVVKSSLSPESCLTENDTIPEEVLEPGSTTASILIRTAESPGGSFVQVDNFVDCEDDASDDEEEETQTLDPVFEDDFLSSNYSPSVPLCPNTSNRHVTEENRTKSQNLNADLDDKCFESKEICYLSEGVSNLPGEVEEQGTGEEGKECDINNLRSVGVIKPNLRQLEISTRLNDGSGTSENNLNVEGEGTDEVQPFTLDTEFDYDNVALTPKFSVMPGKHMF